MDVPQGADSGACGKIPAELSPAGVLPEMARRCVLPLSRDVLSWQLEIT
ncbi:hypothetical protein ACCI51_10260 [Microbulbifer echini]|uniref:Uncharacterized protein n=1 Tax=Microbulbifer echini TaxID=1529067 RepID=A0ABV4NNG6_9GAMM|nr:hypothetical protein [uncultured Microbulbifer sp.]